MCDDRSLHKYSDGSFIRSFKVAVLYFTRSTIQFLFPLASTRTTFQEQSTSHSRTMYSMAFRIRACCVPTRVDWTLWWVQTSGKPTKGLYTHCVSIRGWSRTDRRNERCPWSGYCRLGRGLDPDQSGTSESACWVTCYIQHKHSSSLVDSDS